MTEQNYECSYQAEQMEVLTNLTNQILSEIRTLNQEHRHVMRWLLITVCVLALGKALPEIKDAFWTHANAQAEITGK